MSKANGQTIDDGAAPAVLDDPFDALMAQLADPDFATRHEIVLFRITPQAARGEIVGTVAGHEFDPAAVGAVYGAGRYIARPRGIGTRAFAKPQAMFNAAGPVRPATLAGTVNPPGAAPATGAEPQSLAQMVQQAVREALAAQTRPAESLTLRDLIPLLQQPQRPAFDWTGIIGAMGALPALMKAFAPKSSVQEVTEAMKAFQEMSAREPGAASGGGGEAPSEMESFIRAIGPYVQSWLAAQQQQPAQPPAQRPAAPALAQQPQRPALAAQTDRPPNGAAGTAPPVSQHGGAKARTTGSDGAGDSAAALSPAPPVAAPADSDAAALALLAQELGPVLRAGAAGNREQAAYAEIVADWLEAHGVDADGMLEMAPPFHAADTIALALTPATTDAMTTPTPLMLWLRGVETVLRGMYDGSDDDDEPAAVAGSIGVAHGNDRENHDLPADHDAEIARMYEAANHPPAPPAPLTPAPAPPAPAPTGGRKKKGAPPA